MGDARRATHERFVIVGGHLDSVPNGGWLDGALNVVAGLEVLRALAHEERPLTLKLVDWADEEGARFGRSLLGSSACAGTLDPEAVRGLTDRDGTALPDALAAHGVDARPHGRVRRAARGRGRLPRAAHRAGAGARAAWTCRSGVVLGTFGVQRHMVRFTGAHAHAGATPMDLRRDAFLAAARSALAWRDDAARARRRARDHRAREGLARDRDRVQRHLRGLARPARARRRRARRHARRRRRTRPSGSPPRRAARSRGSRSGRSSRSRSTPS